MRGWLLSLGILVTGCGGSVSRLDDAGAETGGQGGAATGGGGGTAGRLGPPVGGTGTAGTGTAGTGTAGTGGTAQGGSAGAGQSAAECLTADDCVLMADCCSCVSIPRDSPYGQCDAACAETACEALGVDQGDVGCSAGRCVIARSCDQREVVCFAAVPECPHGQAPVVANRCYTGRCMPVSECSGVSSCDVCESAGLSCVRHDTGFIMCIDTPAACEANPTCSCMGACTAPSLCGDPESEELECYCPVC